MAAVFKDVGKMPDCKELLTIWCRSTAIELNIVLKKSEGNMSKQHVEDLRCLTIYSRCFWSITLKCDIVTKLCLGGCRDGRESVLDWVVPIIRLIFVIFSLKKHANSLHFIVDVNSDTICCFGFISLSTMINRVRVLLILLLIISDMCCCLALHK